MTSKVYIHIIWINQNAQYTVNSVDVSVPGFLYAVTMLIFQIKRYISSKKWLNYIIPFFPENAKNLGRSDNAKQRKKTGMALVQ